MDLWRLSPPTPAARIGSCAAGTSPRTPARTRSMNRMRKPDRKLGPDQQDKRSLVLLEELDFERWLYSTVA